jgi:hypothetical protein
MLLQNRDAFCGALITDYVQMRPLQAVRPDRPRGRQTNSADEAAGVASGPAKPFIASSPNIAATGPFFRILHGKSEPAFPENALSAWANRFSTAGSRVVIVPVEFLARDRGFGVWPPAPSK